MKKVFKFMMMALVAIVMSAGFAACSSDDDDNKTPETPKKEDVKTYKQTIDLTFSEDLQALVQPIMLYITDGDSINHPGITGRNVKNGQFKQEMSYMHIPKVYSYSVDLSNYYQEKIAELPEKDSYDLTWTDNSVITAYKNGGEDWWSDTIKTTYGKTNVKKSEIDAYIRENFYQKKFTVNIGDIIKKHEQK